MSRALLTRVCQEKTEDIVLQLPLELKVPRIQIYVFQTVFISNNLCFMS